MKKMKRNKGFTGLELLIVILILGILAIIIVGNLEKYSEIKSNDEQKNSIIIEEVQNNDKL
ncbi:MAG: prepilin-type N-terminal cleavage/methylation domain-containing protein [Asgard group archaeon]|nr:prepilin-type N-terminal cleavage/methylation domain-containing protein [Asgard group archaeon]